MGQKVKAKVEEVEEVEQAEDATEKLLSSAATPPKLDLPSLTSALEGNLSRIEGKVEGCSMALRDLARQASSQNAITNSMQRDLLEIFSESDTNIDVIVKVAQWRPFGNPDGTSNGYPLDAVTKAIAKGLDEGGKLVSIQHLLDPRTRNVEAVPVYHSFIVFFKDV